MKYLAAMYLGINAWTDWKEKKIDCRYAAVFAAGVLIWRLYAGEAICWTGILPGFSLYVLSLFGKKRIGSGDGIVTAALGWALGPEIVWNVIVGGFFLAGAAGVFLWMRGKRKNTEMAFVPFLLVSYLFEIWNR